MILNKLIFYNTNYWKKIIKNNFFVFFYKHKRIRNKIKQIKKLRWLISKKHINVIFSRDDLKYMQKKQSKIRNKKTKIKFLKNKQYEHILFKLEKKYKEKKKIKKLGYKKNKQNV